MSAESEGWRQANPEGQAVTVTVDPAALRFFYRPFDEPVRHTTTGLDGRSYTTITRGALRIEWDAPEGTFAYVLPQDDKPAAEDLDELRSHLASCVQAAYEASPKPG